jgi:hypothetical protein
MAKLFEALDVTFAHGNIKRTDLSVLLSMFMFEMLFSLIERFFRPSVSSLFRGTISDYIKCSAGHERQRNDLFSEIALSIR